ncbi:hypothetical protein BD324DRAFT_631119 [Kockovaella imperatae]|uniref:Uncharacterized protein n=1 Tax=Kockovaella imperatae TaxID=4999 RepID=A0A1Y1UCB3_9TREE|nr:hypothetical protein BD324DRAFT_631119 [Kockovaella imperatae]ORX35681.1 hypothetical protein BD324DRAFT_631119 [Kockovaella imperatae]
MSAPPGDEDFTELSPSQAFRPRNPGVVRTPPGGHKPLPSQSTSSATPAAPVATAPEAMETDDAGTRQASSSRTPLKANQANTFETPGQGNEGEAGPSQDMDVEATRTPRSTRKNRPSAQKPMEDVSGMDLEGDESIEEGEYGRRWRKTMETLELATKAAAQKWTAKDLKQSFPSLAEDDSGEMDAIWLQAAQTMRERLLELGMDVMKHYKVPSSLQQIDQVVKEGETYAQEHRKDKHGRRDAWRPDITPEILTAATQLPLYDETHARIRDEYVLLHEDCRKRYLSILEKQARLDEMEGGVAEGIAELEKTISLLGGFPSEEMMVWMEESSAMTAGVRDQRRRQSSR